MENIDNVNSSIVSEPASPAAVEEEVSFYYGHNLRLPSGIAGRDERVVILYSSIPGGRASPPTVGIGPTSFSFSATAGGARAASSVNAALNLGPTDDTVSILTRNVDDLQFGLSTGDGDDTVVVDAQNAGPFSFTRDGRGSGMIVDLGEGNDVAEIDITGISNVALDLTAGPGNDVVKSEVKYYTITLTNARVLPSINQHVDLGPSNDRLVAASQDFSKVATVVIAGEGDDTVELNTQWTTPAGRFRTLRPRPIDQSVDLGPDDDRLTANSDGYTDVTTSIDAGDGDDTVIVSDVAPVENRHVRHRMFSIVDRTELNAVVLLGPGSDSLVLESRAYRKFSAQINTGTANDGHDEILVDIQFVPSIDRVQNIGGTLDHGLDDWSLRAEGYEPVFLLPSTSDTRDLGITTCGGGRHC